MTRKIRSLWEKIKFEIIYRRALVELSDAITQARRELAEKI